MITKYFLEINNKLAGDKYKLSPIGDVCGLDERRYLIDGNDVINALKEQGLDIPLDENHSGGVACGWIPVSSLELRSDGIYGDIIFTQKGEELISKRFYRYLSPTFVMDNGGRVVKSIDSVGLVNTPNLLDNALNSKKNNDMGDLVEVDVDVVDVVNELKDMFYELKECVSALKDELEILKERINLTSKEIVIDEAIATKKLAANKRKFAMSLSNEQLASYLNLSAEEFQNLGSRVRLEKNLYDNSNSSLKQHIFDQLRIEKGDRK